MKRLITVTTIAMAIALCAAPAALAARKHHKPKPDRGRPTVTYQTPNNASFSNAVLTEAPERMVRGRAGDARSKITMVKVEVKPCKSAEGACELSEIRTDEHKMLSMSGSALHCSSKGKSCSWSFEAPETLGPYQLKAWSFDRAGNVSKTRAIRINVSV